MDSRQWEGNYAPAFAQGRERLSRLTPEQIVESTLVRFESEKSCFYLESFGHAFEVSYPIGDVTFVASNLKPPIDWGLIVLNYLSGAKKIPLTGQWASYRDLPQGNVFFPAIRTHVHEVLARFLADSDREILRQTLLKLKFELLQTKADIAATALFTPRVPVLIQFWDGEDEIPPSCQILFDSSIAEHMHIEDIAALCSVIKDLILRQYDAEVSMRL